MHVHVVAVLVLHSRLVELLVVLAHPGDELCADALGSLGQGARNLLTVQLKQPQRNQLE